MAASAISRRPEEARCVSRHDEVENWRRIQLHGKGTETQEVEEKTDKRRRARTENPLSVMRGELEGLIDGRYPATPVSNLYEETGRLGNMVDAIEELGKAEASLLSLKRQWVEVRPFLQNIQERFRAQSQERGVAMELTCPEGFRLHADPERLSQVILNILANALRATPGGGSVSSVGPAEAA